MYETQAIVATWIQVGFAAIGIPTGIYAIWKLFKNDESRDLQLEALKNIANYQARTVNEFQEQLTEFRAQTKLMAESNLLMDRYLSTLIHGQIIDQASRDALIELEKGKRLLAIRPNFAPHGGSRSSTTFGIHLRNLGKRAYYDDVEIKNISNASLVNKPIQNKIIDENEILKFTLELNKEVTGAVYPTFEFQIRFSDEDGNKYSQRLFSKDMNYSVEGPILCEEDEED